MSGPNLRNRTVFGADCRMQGHMELDNDAAILGRFDGTLKVSGVLDLLESSRFHGLIITRTLRLAGRVEADVIAGESVELLPGAELRGRLFTPRLSVAEGVVLEAQACIGPNAPKEAEKRLAQLELQAHLADRPSLDLLGRQEEPEESQEEEDTPLSIAAHDEPPSTDFASPEAAPSRDSQEPAEPAEVHTMTDAFARILNYRPSKVLRPHPQADVPAA